MSQAQRVAALRRNASRAWDASALLFQVDQLHGPFVEQGMWVRALAAELYLKAAQVLTLGDHERSHDLSRLFRALPDETRDLIESTYRPKMGVGGFQVVHVGNTPAAKNVTYETLQSADALFELCANAFEEWRYSHEGSGDAFSLPDGLRVALETTIAKLSV